jgi:hypothetical protein
MPDPGHIGHNDFAEIYIPAQKPFAITAEYNEPDFYCNDPVSFTPKADSDYEASVFRRGMKCFVSLSKRTDYGWLPIALERPKKCQ